MESADVCSSAGTFAQEASTVRPHRARSDHEAGTDRAGDDGWTPFSLDVPRLPLVTRLRGRHPLVRSVDRIEAALLVLAVAMSLFALPIAAAAGTAVYDSLRHSQVEQAANRQMVEATVGEVSVRGDRTRRADVPATWIVGGVQHSGTVRAPATVESGDTVEVWVDEAGRQVPAPAASVGSAPAQAVATSVLIWAGAVAVAASLFGIGRALCSRARDTRWDTGLDKLADSGGGPARGRP
jgi:hypothetical protein